MDLPKDVHADLKAWCMTAAAELDRANVAQADVVRLLLLRLHQDPELRRFVVESLRSWRR
ncbi:hypothetical protein [Virgisporangium ochraceum]|uniref:hypothetical protein n=1 Tax=Virgisporangium ochraceum TaxID=65505 RepID=UPI001944E7AB|nr:hypothetical protein [Virgisporangium ochraceum]